MGGRVQIRSLIARLALRYLLVFAIVLTALSAGAYIFLAREYTGLLQPALGTPEAAQAYRAAMTRVTLTILAFDLPLLCIVGAASWWLARASLEPLIAARERERAFSADAAHELRSPLATIAALAQAARPAAPAQTREALDAVVVEALDASTLVGELLTLARAAQPELLHREPIDVAAVLAGVTKECAAAAAERAIRLRAEPQSAIVNGDERRLRELARNLVENAVRHAKSSVTVQTRPDGRIVEITVGNDGEAIPREARERVFERFYRLDRGEDGSGLGLAIVRWIAQAHGGEAFVRDRGGGGPEFVVRLPLL